MHSISSDLSAFLIKKLIFESQLRSAFQSTYPGALSMVQKFSFVINIKIFALQEKPVITLKFICIYP